MYRYDGLLIHQSHDDDGILEIIDCRGIRSLHFGSESRQSSLLLSDPNFLVLPYIRAMTAWHLFKQHVQKVLLLGLGGGTLANFFLRYFPACRLWVLENRSSVVKIARSHFGLPLDRRLKIIVADGGRYIRQSSKSMENSFDLILIDAFDHETMSSSLTSAAFFDACKKLLVPDGILAINLWDTDQSLYGSFVEWLDQAFAGRFLCLPVKGKGNVIGFAFNDTTKSHSIASLRIRAHELEQRFGIEYPALLKQLVKHNSRRLNFLIIK